MSEVRWILVADDDEHIRNHVKRVLKERLSQFHLCFADAKDGLEASTKAHQRAFDCIITDLKMPKVGGQAFIDTLKTSSYNCSTPTVVLSSYPDDLDAPQYSQIKRLNKPIAEDALAQMIQSELRQGRLEDRVPAHLLNPFLAGILNIAKDCEITTELQPAIVKKDGDAMLGHYHTCIQIASGYARNRFVISYDSEVLEVLRTKLFANASSIVTQYSREKICNQITQMIFDRSLAAFENQGLSPRLMGSNVWSAKTENDLREAERSVGIVVVIKTKYGRIVAGALGKLRKTG